ncbi:glycosyltransferase [Variovorax paradoxus]|nr:glycosyltransferase [Variovorax paradoxus]MBT2298875.1 glycosyltransferase [Variovorax paradoxus]
MARIAYVDHSYHRSTRSTGFLVEVLRRHGHVVDLFWHDAWQGGPPVAWSEVKAYDIVIMFQSYCQLRNRHFRDAHPNVVYIPMLDQFGLWQGPMLNLVEFWEPFQGSKVLNFSNALHCMTEGFGIASHFVRYYQPLRPLPTAPQEGLHGFFWLRRELQISWRSIKQLIGDARFDSLHLHLAVDPGTAPPELPSEEDIARYRITTSTWFKNKADLDAVMDRANVFFASRPGEGIGQSFLEAMGRGQCVVAPNQGTMNEYILPGVNGLLYDLDDLRPIDFSNVRALGARARQSAEVGREQWEATEKALLRFILTPSQAFYAGKYQHPTLRLSAEGSRDIPLPSTGLRALAQRYSLFRKTRAIWHPLVRIARHVVGR